MKIINALKLIGIVCSLTLATAVYAEKSTAMAVVGDMAVTAIVNTKIALDSTFSHSNFNVKVQDGVVIMSGTVNSRSEIKALIELARSTTGVKSVDVSKLTVQKSNQPMTDFFIEAKVESLFLKERLFGEKNAPPSGVSIEINNGVVYLSGKASDDTQIDHAIMLAKSVTGVTRVVSFIDVPETVQ